MRRYECEKVQTGASRCERQMRRGLLVWQAHREHNDASLWPRPTGSCLRDGSERL